MKIFTVQTFVFLSHLLAVASIILVIDWTIGGQGEQDNLGGLFPINMSNENSDGYVHVENWHPVMMVFGMVFCFVEAVLSFYSWSFLGSINYLKVAKLIHIIWHTACLACIIVGIITVFNSNNYPREGLYRSNLYSLHSWIGLGVVIVYCIQYIFSLYLYFTPLSISPLSLRKRLMPYHIFAGIFLLVAVGMVTQSGITETLGFLPECSPPNSYEKDINPAANYAKLPLVCRKGNWLGACIIATIFLTLGCLAVSRLVKDKNDEEDETKDNMSSNDNNVNIMYDNADKIETQENVIHNSNIHLEKSESSC